MSVVVDTCIWSLALRRAQHHIGNGDRRLLEELLTLAARHEAYLLGVVRQELLSGIRVAGHFAALRERLRTYGDEPINIEDFENAADCFNQCRAAGVIGNVVDMLICSVAIRLGAAISTIDRDFERYARFLPIRLHRPSR